MNKWNSKSDSHVGRESEKYDRPAPSREFLLEYLGKVGKPQLSEDICDGIGISEDEDLCEAVSRRLRAMAREGQLFRNRKGAFCLISKTDLIKGTVSGHHSGFGFVICDRGGDDLYLSSREMRLAMHGDRVLVRVIGRDRKGREEATVVEVVERAHTLLVGRFFVDSGIAFVVPDNPKITVDFVVPPEHVNSASDGQYVECEILRYPGRDRTPAQACVVNVLGDHLSPGMEIQLAIKNNQIPDEWSDAVLAESERIAEAVSQDDLHGRHDLRSLPFVTIDGDDAKDFDDALYCEARKGGGWRLWVAIADVSHYVRPGMAMDVEALERGNSVYFPEHVVPMLPEALSNGICSLKPQVDRLAMVCEMTISASGRVSGYTFYEGVIHSHARLTYDLVGGYLEDPSSELGQMFLEKFGKRAEQIQTLFSLYGALRQQRSERGAIDFETTETRIHFTDHRKIESIVPVVRNDAHKIVEECMLCANVSAGSLIEQLKMPGVFRNHDGPKDEKLGRLTQFLGMLGFVLRGRSGKPKPSELQAVLQAIAERPDAGVIQMIMLRSMGQARYESDNRGHFGLAYKVYSHFTSPIRRYPDLLVHRLIRLAIRNQLSDKRVRSHDSAGSVDKADWYPYSQGEMEQMLEQCSRTERRADDATRDVVQWLKCEYMSNCIGQVYTGVISSVAHFGIFVELEDVYVEGAVHVSQLEGDYYHFDPVHHTLTGEHTRQQFSLGDRVQVLVAGVDLSLRQIDLELVSVLSQQSLKVGGASVRERLAAGRVPNKSGPGRRKKATDGPAGQAASKSKSRSSKGGKSKKAGGAKPSRPAIKKGGAKKKKRR